MKRVRTCGHQSKEQAEHDDPADADVLDVAAQVEEARALGTAPWEETNELK
jgi:hypothetical protein